jgi:class 3 adenylate cyclase
MGAMGETRKIAAILVADVVGYSRLAGADEDRTLPRLRGLRSDLIDPAIDAHHGRIVKRTGDGSLIEFRSVVDAVRCAIEVQNGLIAHRPALSRLLGSRNRRTAQGGDAGGVNDACLEPCRHECPLATPSQRSVGGRTSASVRPRL